MIPIRNRKKTLKITVEEMKNFAFAILVGGRGERVKKITNGSSKSEINLEKKRNLIHLVLKILAQFH